MSSEKGTMLPRPRSTATSRARELRNQMSKASETVNKTASNTPRISSSLASNMLPDMNLQRLKSPSLYREKSPLKHKENTFVANIEAEQNKMIGAQINPPLKQENIIISSGGGDEVEIYTRKKSEFQSMKKELEEKQSKIIEVYSCLKELHSRLAGNERDIDCMEPVVKLLDMSGWSASDLTQFASHIAGGGGGGEVTTPIGDGLEMPQKISEIPAQLIELCHQMFMKRSAIVDSLQQTQLGELQFISNIHEWKAEDESLKTLLESTCQQTEKNASSVANSVSSLVHQAMNRNSKYIQLKELNAQLKKKVENAEKELQEIRSKAGTGLTAASKPGLGKQTNKVEADGQDCTKAATKHYEHEVKMYRTRIRDLERDHKELNAIHIQKLADFQRAEEAVKNQEAHHEHRLRTLHENLRSAEKKMAAVCKQKENLETKVLELNELLEKTRLERADSIPNEEHQKQIGDLQQKLEEKTLEASIAAEDLEHAANNMVRLEKKTRCILELIQQKGFSKQRCEDEKLKALAKAEEDLKKVKQDSARLLKDYSNMKEAEIHYNAEINSKQDLIDQLKRELKSLETELNTSKEKNKYLESLQNESGIHTDIEQQLQEAKSFAVAKVEEIGKLQSVLATKQEEIDSLTNVRNLMEVNHQKCQRHRVKNEKTISLLEQEVQSLHNAQKRKFWFF